MNYPQIVSREERLITSGWRMVDFKPRSKREPGARVNSCRCREAARRVPQVANVDLWITAGRGARLPAQVSSLFGRLCCGGYGTQHVDPGNLRIAGDLFLVCPRDRSFAYSLVEWLRCRNGRETLV
jgi:hypothetical protein